MLKPSHPLYQEVSSAEAAPADGGGGEEAFFSQIAQADDHPNQLNRAPDRGDPAAQPEKKAQDPAAPKKPAEKLGKLEEPAVEKEAAATEDEDLPPGRKSGDVPEKEMSRWKQLRAEEKRAKALDEQVAKFQKEIEELRKSPLSKEVEAELAKLREFRDIQDVKRSDEYVKAVARPMATVENQIMEITQEFKLDADKLFDAMTEKVDWKRNLAIDRLIDNSSEDVPDAIKVSLHKRADTLHDLWQKGADIESKASELRAAQEATNKQSTERQQYEQQQAWKKATAAQKEVVEQTLAPVIKAMTEEERTEFTSAIESAEISEDPEERALQAMAPQIAAVLIRRLNVQAKELAAARAENKALLGGRPGAKETRGEVADPNAIADDDDFFSRVKGADDYYRR